MIWNNYINFVRKFKIRQEFIVDGCGFTDIKGSLHPGFINSVIFKEIGHCKICRDVVIVTDKWGFVIQ